MINLHTGRLSDSQRAERRDAAENRQRILQVALRLFAEHGVANVHMAQIAEEAGVGKGTLYRRFANKGELCQALIHDQLLAHQEMVLARLQQMHTAGDSYLDRLTWFLRAVTDFTEQHVPLLYEMQREGIFFGAEGDAPYFEWQHMTVQGLLRTAAAAGEVPADTDVAALVDLLLAPLTAPYFRYLRTMRDLSPERIGGALASLVEGLKYQ